MAQPTLVLIAVLAAILMPCLLVIIGVVGLNQMQIQDDIDGIWVRKSSDYAKNLKYEEEVMTGTIAGTSMLLGIAVPRDGGTMMKAAHLMELQQRMNLTERITVTVDNMTLTYDDVCYNMAGAYKYPCFRVTMLDCFSQGDYDFSKVHEDTFQTLIVDKAIALLRPPLIKTGLAQTPVAQGGCSEHCTFDGQAVSIVANLGEDLVGPAGTWESQSSCKVCLGTVVSGASPSALDYIYRETLTNFAAKVLNMPLSTFKAYFPTQEALDKLVVDVLRGKLHLNGKSPYTWQMGANLFPQGSPRPSLFNSNGSYKTDAEVLSAVRGTCYAWDEGQALPAINKYITLGGYSNVPAPIQNVNALQNVFLFNKPDVTQALLQSKAAAMHRPGGALNITIDQATEALHQFKLKAESVFSEGWRDAKQGNVEFTAWSDDHGAGGTTQEMLGGMTTKALPQALIFFAIVILLSGAFFFRVSNPLRESRCLLACAGAVLVIMGVVASIGMLAFCNIKMNLSMSYTMPFIMVGILCDDMYMLILSVDATDAALTPEQRFVKAIRSVGVPITVTSVVNFGIFLTLFVVSDLPAIYDVGVTGMICTGVTFLMLMVSFSALVYLDLLRRSAGRMDFGLCCIKAPLQAEEVGATGETCTVSEGGRAEAEKQVSVSPGLLYRRVYQPMLRSRVGKAAVLVVGAACVIVAIVGLMDIEVGLDLEDLYPMDSQPNRFIANRMRYFPVWPATLNFGELDYKSPDVQLRMAKAWENVVATSYIAPGAITPLLWTASFARWGMSSSVPAFSSSLSSSPCSSSNPYTKGMCAEKIYEQHGGPECKATMHENTLGLKLYDNDGFCFPGPMVGINDTKSYCPVFDFATADDHAACLARWNKYTKLGSLTSPGIQLESDGFTPMVPIKLSRAGGSMLYVYNLYKTKDYVSMMKETRKYMDYDKSMHSWMSGIAFAFWEQYLTITEFMWSVGAWSAGAGFVISFVFLHLELTASKLGKLRLRTLSCLTGALLITAVLVTSMITVWGWMSLAKVELSAFSAMAILFASGFAIEYAVHIVHHFLESQAETAVERIDYAMTFLFNPTCMAAVSSFASVLVLCFSDFHFVTKFFFTPLVMVVVVTYFYGAIVLPCVLSFMGFLPRLGPNSGCQEIVQIQKEADQVCDQKGELPSMRSTDSIDSIVIQTI